ncbi:MAG: hypothetical protein ACYDEC_17615 [Bacteroidia bacterium]
MITAAQSFKIYELLNKHFKNEQDAKALVSEIENVIDAKVQAEKDRLATKDDINSVKLEIANTKVDIIKWVFAFFATLALMIMGLYFKK